MRLINNDPIIQLRKIIFVPSKDKVAVLHCTVTLIDCAKVKLLELPVQRCTDPTSILLL